MRIVLCCGDRNWTDYDKIFQTLKAEHEKEPIDFLIEGGQASNDGYSNQRYGADHICKVIAQLLKIQVIECPVNWKLGKSAGPIRNSMQLKLLNMLDDSARTTVKTEVFAFHPDLRESKGTKDMVTRARKAGVKVWVIQ